MTRRFHTHKGAENTKHKKHKNYKAQKLEKAQKKHKNANKWINDFFPLRRSLSALKRCLFCFCSLICVFMLFVVWNLLVKKKKRFKIALIPSFTLLLTCTTLNLPIESYLYALIFIYDHLSESFPFMRIFWIFPFYENLLNLSLLWEPFKFLIYDHLWKSFPFMRTFLNFFLFMIICKNLFESFLIYNHL